MAKPVVAVALATLAVAGALALTSRGVPRDGETVLGPGE